MTAPQVFFGDYDFGVIAGSMHMARVFCCKLHFMQQKAYLIFRYER